jgi:hypothetical protein
MKRTVTHTLIAIAGAVALGITAPAAQGSAASQTDSNEAAEKGRDTSGDAITRMGQALELVGYAREHESPVAMLTAVQMLRGVPTREDAERLGTEATQPVQKGEAAAEQPKDQTAPPALDPAELLKEARAWAEDNQPVLTLIDAELARPAPTRGATLGPPGGPIRLVRTIPARTVVSWNIRFNAGEVAHVNVVGDGDTDLDVYVYDQNGNLITRDIRFGDRVGVSWTPRWTGSFRIEVHNLGRVWNRAIVLMT